MSVRIGATDDRNLRCSRISLHTERSVHTCTTFCMRACIGAVTLLSVLVIIHCCLILRLAVYRGWDLCIAWRMEEYLFRVRMNEGWMNDRVRMSDEWTNECVSVHRNKQDTYRKTKDTFIQFAFPAHASNSCIPKATIQSHFHKLIASLLFSSLPPLGNDTNKRSMQLPSYVPKSTP